MLQVQRQAALVTRRQLPVVVDLASRDRLGRAPWVALARGLDLDDVRAEVRQHRSGNGTGDPARAIDNFQTRKQTFRHNRTPFAACYGAWLLKMMVPDAANMPPTPWQTEILAPGTCAGATPRIWRTLSCSAYMPYMPECI